ncbi:MAG TPA: hypothetical protein VIJ16_04840 [Gemmatimonadaceae bacterium]
MTDPARIPGYQLSPPTESDAVASLVRVFGAERGATIWHGACRAAMMVVGTVNSVARLERAVESLAQRGSAEAGVARSLAIRLRTYARLSAAPRRTPSGPRS